MNPPGPVPSTQWTQIIEVIQGGDDAAAERALSEFCENYYPAVLAFFRLRGRTEEDARDLAQEFFESRILTRLAGRDSFLHEADRRRTRRFRSFLFQVLRHFYVDTVRARMAQKAGGGVEHDSIDLHEPPADGDEARRLERQFDSVFALEIIQRAAARSTHSEQLLAHMAERLSQAEAAAQLDISEDAFKQAWRRFRQRFPHDLREEVARLVPPGNVELDEEIRYLMSLFAEAGA